MAGIRQPGIEVIHAARFLSWRPPVPISAFMRHSKSVREFMDYGLEYRVVEIRLRHGRITSGEITGMREQNGTAGEKLTGSGGLVGNVWADAADKERPGTANLHRCAR